MIASDPVGNSSSLPSRERGLKPDIREDDADGSYVAPFAGAWIETSMTQTFLPFYYRVAPFAGAWIETGYSRQDATLLLSLPSRERGLKLVTFAIFTFSFLSLPSRERGLKHLIGIDAPNMIESLPSRERGLKLVYICGHFLNLLSLPSRERGLKLSFPLRATVHERRRAHRGGVD